jgi:hypothetical protein
MHAGVDAIVAQGYEAGGHPGIFDPCGPNSQLGVVAFTRLLVSKMPIPVVAAGGSWTGSGSQLCWALALWQPNWDRFYCLLGIQCRSISPRRAVRGRRLGHQDDHLDLGQAGPLPA